MASVLSSADFRRVPRDLVSFRTDLTGQDGRRRRAFIVDISPLGLMARTQEPFTPGDTMMIRLPIAGQCPGRVKWALGGRVGIEFDDIIALDLYARLLANAPKDTPRWDEG